MVFSNGQSVGFVLEILRAWKFGLVTCPIEAGQTPRNFPQAPPPQCVHLKMTSGTTGNPKGIFFRAEQLIADAAQIRETMGLRRDWPNVGLISLAHSYGFSNLVLPLILDGIPLILASAPFPELLRRAAAVASRITLPGVPALWRQWSEAGAIPTNVALAISAGAPLPVMLERQIFEKSGLKVHNFYGSTECGGIAFDRTGEPRGDASEIGGPLQGVSLSLNEAGCLRVQSAAVGDTYWPDSDEVLSRGIFQTADLAEIVDGKVFLRGRAVDLINVAGRKIAPEAIEAVLRNFPGVVACVVFGVPDEDRGEAVVATVALKNENELGALKDYARERLPAWQVPREWRRVMSLEESGRGKISRHIWRERFLRKTDS
jgi:long-chain acyl-CoA synthetase